MRSDGDQFINNHQYGFREHRNTHGPIGIVRSLFEKSLGTYVIFLDLKAAFDTADDNILDIALQHWGAPIDYRNVVNKLHTGLRHCVRQQNGKLSELFDAKGIRQGCSAAPQLFLPVLDLILKIAWQLVDEEFRDQIAVEIKTKQGCFIQTAEDIRKARAKRTDWETTTISDGSFADDLSLIARNRLAAEKWTKAVLQAVKIAGMEVSLKDGIYEKCYIMCVGEKETNDMTLLGGKIRGVPNTTYLGVKIQSDGGMDSEILNRISAGRSGLYKVMNSSGHGSCRLSKKRKLMAIKTYVFPRLFYGLETSALTKAQSSKIETVIWEAYRFVSNILKSVWNPISNTWKSNTNESVMAEIKNVDPTSLHPSKFLPQLRLRHLGHVLRLPDDRTDKKILYSVGQKHSRRLKLTQSLQSDLSQINETFLSASESATDRKAWKKKLSTFFL